MNCSKRKPCVLVMSLLKKDKPANTAEIRRFNATYPRQSALSAGHILKGYTAHFSFNSSSTMFTKFHLLLFLCALSCKCFAQPLSPENKIENRFYTISWQAPVVEFLYTLKDHSKTFPLSLPNFEIDGKKMASRLSNIKIISSVQLKNAVTEYTLEGSFSDDPKLSLTIIFQLPPDNEVVRFQYLLSCTSHALLTKKEGSDNISYFSFAASRTIKEVRLSEFNERFHATHLTEYELDERYFENETSFMGPIAVCHDDQYNYLAAYEHGSQYPNRFFEFRLGKDNAVTLSAVKGNYLKDQSVDGFTSAWFQFAALRGDENKLAERYRNFVLRYLTVNSESRKPYIFYNTWGRQERVEWTGEKYLASMKLDWTLQEIDRAHAMGVEVYVLDAGWFKKTGDWEVNTDFFPDGLKQVKAKLDEYHMKLGLWFNPTVAALSSDMHKSNLPNRMSFNGIQHAPREIWETEKSVDMCLVSGYWQAFADKLINLTQTYGVSYFKWDGIGQYGCNDPGHFHGGKQNTPEERSERYAYLLPEYMTKIVNCVCAAAPQSIFDFDVTEDGRCVGLEFLSAGKYFIINNGPYYHNFDLAPLWKSVLPSGNANIFVQPGPARGWFVRSVLDYDKWIPSVLFLTHYQSDEPRNSQLINIGSLMLGQNGIWGEILKTSDTGVKLFDSVLTKYKQIREDVTAAQMAYSGEPGGSPEIYEKINPQTGKGCVVIFAGKGKYSYITQHSIAFPVWKNDEVDIKKDSQGRAIFTVTFEEPSAKIFLFGVD